MVRSRSGITLGFLAAVVQDDMPAKTSKVFVRTDDDKDPLGDSVVESERVKGAILSLLRESDPVGSSLVLADRE